MPALEREYYEFERFWNPDFTSLGESDYQRIEAISGLVAADVVSVLDVGCGNGIFCNHIAQRRPAKHVVGLDRSNAALKYVQTHKVLGDITELPFEDKAFDCVTALEVLEHLPQATFELARKELSRVATKYLIVSVPNNQRLGENLTQCPACKTKFDPDLHLRSFNADNLKALFSQSGFRCREVNELGPTTRYVGFQYAMNLWYGRQPEVETMASPLCPICGFRNDEYLFRTETQPVPVNPGPPAKTFLAPAKGFVKRFWPKVTSSQWLVALYERQS